MDNNEDIYKKLREVRRSRGLTVHKLAEKMGENHQKVGRIERGKRSLTLDYLVKAAKALEMPVEALMQEADVKTSQPEQKQANNSSLLNSIIVLVEEKKDLLPFELTPQQKGKFISKIYELCLQIPPNAQSHFIDSFFEGICSVNN